MKTIKKRTNNNRYFAFLFVLLLLFQSCTIYRKSPVSLKEAAKEQKKARVQYNNYEIYRFQRIVEKNSHFYGVKKEKGELVKSPIEANRLDNVRLHNESLSTILSIFVPVAIIGGIILIAANSITVDPGWGG